MLDIKFIKSKKLRKKPNTKNMGFGKYYADYMFSLDIDSKGTITNAKISPYKSIPFNPACMVLHYAQETFEGMKAYKTPDGTAVLFRPEMNAVRFQNSNERLCMPKISTEDYVQAVKEVVKANVDWIPIDKGTSLYIRPFMFAYDAQLGVHASRKYKFIIILSPVASYYKNGLTPVKIYVEDTLVRAVKGGTGFAKCGGNYASSILAQENARKKGYDQVLWLDAIEHKYVEEVGTMNVMFLINDEIVTSPLEGSVLPGVTRDSMIKLLKHWGYKVSERKLSINELMEAASNNTLKEAFGTGTAAVISPIGQLCYKNQVCVINNEKIGPLAQKLYDTLTKIQNGTLNDEFDWVVKVN